MVASLDYSRTRFVVFSVFLCVVVLKAPVFSLKCLLKEWDGDEGVEEIDWFDDDFFCSPGDVFSFHGPKRFERIGFVCVKEGRKLKRNRIE